MSVASDISSETKPAGWTFGGARAGLRLASLAVAAIVLAPIVSLTVIAARGSGDLWPHLIGTILPQAVLDTAILLSGVGALVTITGVGAAWLVATRRFPGHGVLEWALLMPLAVPSYIVAYVYMDALHPLGPLPTLLRGLLGIASPRDLKLPDMRSMGGAVFVLSVVLYPYVYMTARAAFLVQCAATLEVARTLGAGPMRTFLQVALPLARPAIVVGLSLALMEAVNDIGASEFLGVRTLTVSIYTTWVNRSSLPGAAQIALVMLAVIVALVAAERWARRQKGFTAQRGKGRPPVAPIRMRGLPALGATVFCTAPVILGFIVPAGQLGYEAWRRIAFAGISETIGREAFNSALFATFGTLAALTLGLIVTVAARALRGNGVVGRIASLGYAIPGTVLAVGLLVPFASVDNWIDQAARALFGVSTGLLLSGSGVALTTAYAIRFLAIPIGSIEAGYAKMSPNLDMAAASLGRSLSATVRAIHLPLLSPAIATAALLVFVDCVKELSATLLLRPFNFETLATHIYAEAARGTYEDGAIAALLIVAVGLVPVLMIARLTRGRDGPATRRAAAEAAEGLRI